MAKENKQQSLLGLIITAVIAIAMIVLIIALMLNIGKFNTRTVTNDDISFDTSTAMNYDSLETEKLISFTYTPVKDIESLEFSFKVYDENQNVIGTQTYTVGSVKADKEQTIMIDWKEIDDETIATISTMTFQLKKGTVKK